MGRHRIMCTFQVLFLLFFIFVVYVPVWSSEVQETGYYIRVGSFKAKANANKEVKRLKKNKAFMREVIISGEKWYSVFLGPYKSKNEAREKARMFKKRRLIASYYIQKLTPSTPPREEAKIVEEIDIKQKTPEPAEPKVSEEVLPPVVMPPEPKAAVQKPAPEKVGVGVREEEKRIPAAAISDVPQIPLEEKKPPERVVSDTRKEKITEPLREVPPKKDLVTKAEKDWFITAAYNVWYMDMSGHYVNANFASKGFVHGPTIGFSKGNFGIYLTYLSTMGTNTFDADREETFDSGEKYRRYEKFKREDYDATLRYTFYDGSLLSASALAGFKYTRLYDMESTYYRTAGEYTITGHFDIYGPMLGMEFIFPLGERSRTPLFLALEASGMYLRATGKHPQFVPASGGAYGTRFEGADFSSYGWGSHADAHLIWKIVYGLQLHLGGQLQSARLTDTSPQGYTMRTSNGYYGGYARLLYNW